MLWGAMVLPATLQVAWIKADTKAILAIDEHAITNDARLSVTHSDYNTWTLNIKDARPEDRGTYMCQVNTNPMKSQVSARYAGCFFPLLSASGFSTLNFIFAPRVYVISSAKYGSSSVEYHNAHPRVGGDIFFLHIERVWQLLCHERL